MIFNPIIKFPYTYTKPSMSQVSNWLAFQEHTEILVHCVSHPLFVFLIVYSHLQAKDYFIYNYRPNVNSAPHKRPYQMLPQLLGNVDIRKTKAKIIVM